MNLVFEFEFRNSKTLKIVKNLKNLKKCNLTRHNLAQKLIIALIQHPVVHQSSSDQE